jgi:ABC-type multidrug transport system fused ATPase/permease subunit
MAFEELKENTEDIQEQVKAYIDKNVAYYKLWGFKVVMKSTTAIMELILISFFFLFFVLFISLAGAFAISEALGSYTFGFLIIGSFYLLLIAAAVLFKNKLIEQPVLKKFSDIYFND